MYPISFSKPLSLKVCSLCEPSSLSIVVQFFVQSCGLFAQVLSHDIIYTTFQGNTCAKCKFVEM
jgi:hypothetical protein